MRLICGLFQLDGAAANESHLRAMAAQMEVPRLGPRQTLWCEGPAALAVIEFAGESAAIRLPGDGTRVVAADVRLDEPDALARAVGCRVGEADDALLLAALTRFGAAGLDRVLGDFAFASWDKKAERLVCGRDVFGIRPLVYVHRPGELFAFASLPKALYGAGIVARKVDQDVLARRVARRLRHEDNLVAGIKRLPPAHVVEVSRDGILLKRYWQLDRAATGTRQCSAEEAARELRRLLTEAVRCRLPRNGEVGAQLSGGLDSSAVAVLAARALREQGRRLHAYSYLDRPRNDVALEDQVEPIKAVLDQEPDIDWSAFRAPAVPFLHDSCTVFDSDNMVPLNADIPQNAARTRAEAQGVKLILSGWGGDEGATFNARGALAELFLRGRWGIVAREISSLGRDWRVSRWRIFRGEVLSYLWSDFVPRLIQPLAALALRRPPVLRELYRQVLSADVRERLAISRDQPLAMTANAGENRWRLLTSTHIAEVAEIHAQLGARQGLAFAFPLLDRRLVEFVLSLPSELFFRDGIRRVLFRDAMADVLPAKVRRESRKLPPFPGLLIDHVERRDDILRTIEAYEKIEIVRTALDLAWLREKVRGFPSPEEVREALQAGRPPATAANVVAVMRGLEAAAYLAQHADERAPGSQNSS